MIGTALLSFGVVLFFFLFWDRGIETWRRDPSCLNVFFSSEAVAIVFLASFARVGRIDCNIDRTFLAVATSSSALTTRSSSSGRSK